MSHRFRSLLVLLAACTTATPALQLVATDSSGAPATSISFPDTIVGGTATVVLHVRDGSHADAGAITLATAGDFAIDHAGTTCTTLAAGEMCDVAVAFAPVRVGAATGTLVAVADREATLELPLTGTGVNAGLAFVPAVADFGPIDLGETAMTTLELDNLAAAPALLDAIAVTGPGFKQGSTTCGASLATGAACTITVSFSPSNAGLAAGMLTVRSGGHDYVAPLMGAGAHEVTVLVGGDGTVTSTPAGIDACNASCTASFATDVVLTAVPGTGAVLASWSGIACAGPTCEVPLSSVPQTVTATFLTTGITLAPGMVDWGVTDPAGAVRTFQLENGGTTAAAIGGMLATGRFAVAGTTCGPTLAAGASCSIDVRFTPVGIAPATGTLEVQVDGYEYDARLAGAGNGRVTVTVQGDGRVVSTPAGIDCGTTCSATFSTSVGLDAIPGPGLVLLSWSEPGCTGSFCGVQPGTSVTATFGPPDTFVDVTFAGNAPGFLRIFDGWNAVMTICNGSCSVPVTAGGTFQLTALTPGTTAQISGACSAASTTPTQETWCSFLAARGHHSVTVTFEMAPADGWVSLSPLATSVIGAAFDSTGDLVVARSDQITKYDTTGVVLWTRSLAIDSVVSAADGTLYATSSGNLIAIGGDGSTTASRAFTGKLQFLGPTGHLFGLDSATGLSTEWDATGAVVRALAFGPVLGMDSSGIFYGLTATSSGYEGPRWQADGTPLTSFPEVAPSTAAGAGLVVVGDHIVGFDDAGYESRAPDGSLEVAYLDGNGTTATSQRILDWYSLAPGDTGPPNGIGVEVYSFATMSRHELDLWGVFDDNEPCFECVYDIEPFGDITLVSGPDGQIAVIGVYDSFDDGTGGGAQRSAIVQVLR